MKGDAVEAPESVLVPTQAQSFEEVAGNDVLNGALHDLARQFGVTTDDFLTCLDGLVRANWVAVVGDSGDLVSIRLEP